MCAFDYCLWEPQCIVSGLSISLRSSLKTLHIWLIEETSMLLLNKHKHTWRIKHRGWGMFTFSGIKRAIKLGCFLRKTLTCTLSVDNLKAIHSYCSVISFMCSCDLLLFSLLSFEPISPPSTYWQRICTWHHWRQKPSLKPKSFWEPCKITWTLLWSPSLRILVVWPRYENAPFSSVIKMFVYHIYIRLWKGLAKVVH